MSLILKWLVIITNKTQYSKIKKVASCSVFKNENSPSNFIVIYEKKGIILLKINEKTFKLTENWNIGNMMVKKDFHILVYKFKLH